MPAAGHEVAAPRGSSAPEGGGARERFRLRRIAHWDRVARDFEARETGRAYHRRLAETYRHLIPEGARVLEIGCGTGDLLAALRPSVGVGVDFSGETLRIARARHAELTFVEQDGHELEVESKFDFVILSDLVNDLWDVQGLLARVLRVCTPSTRLIVNLYSRLWEPPLALATRLRLKRPMLQQNWLTPADLGQLLGLAGFEVLRGFQDVVWPVATPLVARFANAVLSRLWPFRYLALTNFVVARPVPARGAPARAPTVTVVVPARNEADNIEQIMLRTPEMGGGTELVFVEGHSSDDTYAAIERCIAAHPERRARLLRQMGKGKGDAVRLGFSVASGDVLMILDADLTVPPEDLPRFYDALVAGKGEFINGVRLVYPMEERAMRFLNLLGNKFFSLAFSWLLGQSIKDTLCGTKVLWRRDYERIAANRAYFGDFDPFGDFDLIFGAAKQSLKLVDLPIRYGERTYGTTNIQRFRHGLILLRMVVFAAGRIKFV